MMACTAGRLARPSRIPSPRGAGCADKVPAPPRCGKLVCPPRWVVCKGHVWPNSPGMTGEATGKHIPRSRRCKLPPVGACAGQVPGFVAPFCGPYRYPGSPLDTACNGGVPPRGYRGGFVPETMVAKSSWLGGRAPSPEDVATLSGDAPVRRQAYARGDSSLLRGEESVRAAVHAADAIALDSERRKRGAPRVRPIPGIVSRDRDGRIVGRGLDPCHSPGRYGVLACSSHARGAMAQYRAERRPHAL
jgi:hypothetical protein